MYIYNYYIENRASIAIKTTSKITLGDEKALMTLEKKINGLA